jgi:class 3 adenylate cyclase
MTRSFPEVRYALADGVHIAYEVRGDGPFDLVRIPGTATSLVGSFLDPVVSAHYDHLASFSRLIRLDRRGIGLSDPPVEGGAPLLEQQVEDVLAVMDTVESQRAGLYAGADGGAVAILFAAMHPERVSALVLNSPLALRGLLPGGQHSEQERRAFAEAVSERWGDLDAPFGLEFFAPSRLDEPGFARLLARVQQVSASKGTVATTWGSDFDVSAAMPLIEAPALVLCGAEASGSLVHSQFVADTLPNARLVTMPDADTYFGVHTPEMGAIIEEFLTGTTPFVASDRVLTTVMFTDIVESTSRLAEAGDRGWRAQLDRHDEIVRATLRRFGGTEVNTRGDGFFMVFDGPARAIHCAREIAQSVRDLAIDVRAGIHVGESEKRGDDLTGMAVHIGARVCDMAGAGEILVTSTVRDLVVGSGITFAERGGHTLKGVPGEWTILAAEA